METAPLESTSPPLVQRVPHKDHSAKITAIALALIALLFTGAGFILMGVGTTPATMHVGFGVMPYFMGSQLLLLSGGLFLLSLFFVTLGIRSN